MPFAVACSNTEKVLDVAVAPLNLQGGPAEVEGPIRVTVQSGTGTFLQDPAKPLAFDAVSGDVAGDTVYLVEADADLGAGERLISDLVTLTVSGASAVSFGFTSGAVVPK